VEDDRNSLAFGGRGTYNPANRGTIAVGASLRPGEVNRIPGLPARKFGIPKQDLNAKRSRRNAVAAKVEKEVRIPVKAISQRSKEPY
jgi:hypothetical protein